MPDMADTINPNNIGKQLDGAPALRITVLANPQGEAFDVETGNAGPVEVANAIEGRYRAGLWSLCYVNETTAKSMRSILQVPWIAASLWPAPGVYLWAATGGAVPGTVPPWCWVQPIAVQDRYLGTVDLSTVFGPFPARVAGYIDGGRSVWPAAAWSRFTRVISPPPGPLPVPPSVEDEELPYLITAPNRGYAMTDGLHKREVQTAADGSAYTNTGKFLEVSVSDAEFDSYPAAT